MTEELFRENIINLLPEIFKNIGLLKLYLCGFDILSIVNTCMQVGLTIGVIAAWRQLKESKKQAMEIHEAKRRENTIEILKDWHSSAESGTRFLAKQLVKELPKKTKQNILKYKRIEVDSKVLPYIKGCVCHKVPCCKADCNNCSFVYSEYKYICDETNEHKKIFKIRKYAIIIVRQTIVSYLNLLETIASAYRHNIIDRDIIDEELLYLSTDEENLLSLINEFEQKGNLPCIEFMIENMKKKTSEGKKKLGKS